MHLMVRDMSGKKRLPTMTEHSTKEQLEFDDSLTPATKQAWAEIAEAYSLIEQAMLCLSRKHKDVRFSLELRRHYLNDAEVNCDGKPTDNN